MPTMNETSTITLPEYHNLLALLLLNLNTPPVSSSSTTQEEEMIKKKKRDNAHIEPGARQQNRASRQVPDPDKETDLTHKTRYQKERDECHIKKRKTDKTSLPPASTQTQTIHPREESHPKKKKEKPHDTFPPHQPASPRDPSRHRPTSNHPLLPIPTPPPSSSLHPIRIPSTRLLTPATIP